MKNRCLAVAQVTARQLKPERGSEVRSRRASRTGRARQQRAGLTLIELVSSMAASVVLIAGLAAAVGVSVQSMSYAPVVSSTDDLPGSGVGMLRDDLNDAAQILQIDSDAVTVRVPDRTGDGRDEEIAYSITEGQLQRVINDGDPVAVAEPLNAASLKAAGPPADSSISLYRDPHDRCWIQDTRVVANNDDETSIDVPVPAGTNPGDLLLAAVGIDDDVSDSLAAAAGWQPLHVERRGDHLTVGLWYRIADGSESSTMTATWSDSEDACGWMMRISGVNIASPISASQLNEGTAYGSYPFSVYSVTGNQHLDQPNLLNVRFVFVTHDALFDKLAAMSGFNNVDWVEAPDSSSSVECCIAARHEPGYLTTTTGGYYPLERGGYYIACELLIAPSGA